MSGLMVGLMVGGISSAGASSALTQVDPTTVPQGELALQSKVGTPFTIDVGGHEQSFSDGAEVTVEHYQFPAGTSSAWHAHGGPAFVVVVSGTLTVYEAKDERCKGKRYPAGTGFVEFRGDVHDARNEGATPVDVYITYTLPPGSGDNGLYEPKPDFSNRDCHFAN